MAKIRIMTNTACQHLYDRIDDSVLIPYKDELEVQKFSDGELSVKPINSVRGAYVYLFAETSHNMMELILTLDSLTRASVKGVTLILPYYGYGRQDKRGSTRGSLGAKAVANVVSNFKIVERVVSIDLHADQIQMAWDIPVEPIQGHTIFLDRVQKLVTDNMVLCSPDSGGIERVTKYSEKLGLTMVSLNKRRIKANEVDSVTLIGDVKGKDVLIIDDMVDTANTLVKAVNYLIDEKGAGKIIYAATHPVLSGNGLTNVGSVARIEKLLVSNTIHQPDIRFYNKIETICCMPIMQKVIRHLIEGRSVSELNM